MVEINSRDNTVGRDEAMESFMELCHEAGLRVTPQRLAVYEALLASDEHPSAEMVCRMVREKFPHVSLDTVNRTLQTLAQIGAAFVVEGTGEPKRFDGKLHDHLHFRCVRCRRVVDFGEGAVESLPVPAELGGAFTILRSTVYYEGVCDQCAGTPKA